MKVVRIGNFVMVVKESEEIFSPKVHAEEISEDFFPGTANELRKEQKVQARHAKRERSMIRKSSKRYIHLLSHRFEDPHKAVRSRESIKHLPYEFSI